MDGTYNNPFAQGQTPLSPDTPTAGGSYQVNINRKKTRKWVEAKVQNYDGDDWGADESEDDEPEPAPPVSRVTTGLRSIGQRLPSEQHRASPRLAAAAASSSRSSSGPPSLQLQTGQSSIAEAKHTAPPIPTVPAHVQEATRNLSSPVLSQGLPSAAGFQSETRSSTPLSTTSSTPARSSPLVRPSELSRHVEDHQKPTGSPQPTTDTAVSKPGERFTPPFEEASRQVTNVPTTFAAIEKREPVVEAYLQVDRNRSVSPKLPDVSRMSVFGSDFFSTPNEPQDPIKHDQPKTLEPLVTEAPSSRSVAASSVESQSHQGELSVNSTSQPPILSPMPDPRSIPPLRTPSPNTKGIAPPAKSSNAATSQVSGTPTRAPGPEITPTEPLQPRLDSSTSDFQPQPLLRESTLNTATSSPVKDSDLLSDEIMRTLSPVGTVPTPSPLGDNSTSLAPVDRRDTRNSSYTLRDYDNYWEDATEKQGPEEKSGETVTAPTPAPGGVQGSQAAVRPTDTPSSTVPTMAPSSDDNEASSEEHQDLRRRFSWEAGFEPPNDEVLKGESPADGSSKGVPRINTPSSLGQSDIQSPKDVVSDMASPVVDTPKIARTPSGDISQQPSMLSIAPQPQLLPSMLEVPSPVSTKTDESTTVAPEHRRESAVDEKMLVETTSRPVSMTPPPDERPTSTTSAPPPGQLPEVMGVKEIMGLPTPEQRIAKYEETQRAFAAAESGLDNWILSLKNQHPEYADATASFSGVIPQIAVQGGNVASSVGSNPSTQQPYYQQYLNASSPSVNAPAPSRSKIGRLPISSQATSSAFGNSGNQIGTKGKEFMHSAGKMGKGLFSKGKSKLRGTGDKVFH